MSLIARHNERQDIAARLSAGNAEFIAVYGRRRVGKTFLIRECANAHDDFLEFVGVKRARMATQVANFIQVVDRHFGDDGAGMQPSSWLDALAYLHARIEGLTEPVVLFFDELPWLATQRSGFLQALDYYWNAHWSKQSNINVIVCGSAASWMIKKVINAKGGLHNRLTKTLLLKPLTLLETDEFLRAYKFRLNHHQVLSLYLVTGGVPFYLQQCEPALSIVQNIQKLCFEDDGFLRGEFTKLFQALFDKSEINLRIIRAISKKRKGLARAELLKTKGLPSGGNLNTRLDELIAAGFIQRYVPIGNKKRDSFYRVIDEYSLFYLTWIEPTLSQGLPVSHNYWKNTANSPAWQSWSGYAFEAVCFKHTHQIATALGLDDIGYIAASWQYTPPAGSADAGAQIDLLFDRDDNAVTLCEIKYSGEPYAITKPYAKSLDNKMDVFAKKTKSNKQLFLAMVAAGGLKPNLWSEDLVHHVATLEDLFKDQ